MPKLQNLILGFFVEGLNKEKEFYMKLIEKILSMKLFYINIKLFGEESEHELYSYNELKKLYRDNYFKNLNKIECVLKYLDENEILKIQGDNESVKEISLIWKNKEKEAVFLNLYKKFPNL